MGESRSDIFTETHLMMDNLGWGIPFPTGSPFGAYDTIAPSGTFLAIFLSVKSGSESAIHEEDVAIDIS
jgi:hypothetical protein